MIAGVDRQALTAGGQELPSPGGARRLLLANPQRGLSVCSRLMALAMRKYWVRGMLEGQT